MEEKKVMRIVSEDGSTEEVEVVFAFEFKDNKKEYVIYTKNERDEDNNITVYVSNVESGKHNISLVNALKFCNYYGMSVEYFLEDK